MTEEAESVARFVLWASRTLNDREWCVQHIPQGLCDYLDDWGGEDAQKLHFIWRRKFDCFPKTCLSFFAVSPMYKHIVLNSLMDAYDQELPEDLPMWLEILSSMNGGLITSDLELQRFLDVEEDQRCELVLKGLLLVQARLKKLKGPT